MYCAHKSLVWILVQSNKLYQIITFLEPTNLHFEFAFVKIPASNIIAIATLLYTIGAKTFWHYRPKVKCSYALWRTKIRTHSSGKVSHLPVICYSFSSQCKKNSGVAVWIWVHCKCILLYYSKFHLIIFKLWFFGGVKILMLLLIMVQPIMFYLFVRHKSTCNLVGKIATYWLFFTQCSNINNNQKNWTYFH